MAPFPNRFEESVVRCGVRRGDRVLVAFSGGADSTALLHALARLAPAAGFTLAAAHLNHGFRPEADAELQFCRTQCELLQIPFRGEKIVIPPGRGSRQMEARLRRYAFLEESAAFFAADWIALGHHADDAVETLFLKLLAGTSPAGLAAIPSCRGRFIRPLVPFVRAELVAWLEAEGIPWCEDASNTGTAYRRNFLRNRVFPLLEERWPSFRRAARRLIDTMAEENRFWEAYLESRGLPQPPASGPVTVPLALLRPLEPAACARYLSWITLRFGRMPGKGFFRSVPQLLRDDRARLWYRDRTWWLYSREGVLHADTAAPAALLPLPFCAVLGDEVLRTPAALLTPGQHSFPVLPGKKFFQEQVKKGIFFFDAARLAGPVTVRSRRPGDRLALPGGGSGPLKKLLIDSRVPVRLRVECLVLEDRQGVLALIVPGDLVHSRLAPRVLLSGPGPALRVLVEPCTGACGADGTGNGGG